MQLRERSDKNRPVGQAGCRVLVSLLSEETTGWMVSGRGTTSFPLSTVTQKACESISRAMFPGHAEWKPASLPGGPRGWGPKLGCW